MYNGSFKINNKYYQTKMQKAATIIFKKQSWFTFFMSKIISFTLFITFS